MFVVDERVPLAPFTTLGVGGMARWFVAMSEVADVPHVYAWARARNLPVHVLAGGSNVLLADRGFPGLVLRVVLRGIAEIPERSSVLITAAAGEAWDPFVAWAISRGLAGIECLSGIPGSVGATPIQNVGAYGQEVAEVIESVSVFDSVAERMVVLDGRACGFSYRGSRFKYPDAGRFLVCSVTFRLRPAPATVKYPDVLDRLRRLGVAAPTLADVRRVVLEIRRAKGMVVDAEDADTRSVGSFFTNPVVDVARADVIQRAVGTPMPRYVTVDGRVKLPAAWLLEQVGAVRGFSHGAVGLSSKHPLAVTNRGGASAAAVVAFAAELKRRVEDRFGLRLVPEPTLVGFEDDEDVRYLCAGDEPPRLPA